MSNNLAYKHSGAFGDLIYSLAIAKHFGPGRFYLHLEQLNWIGQYYYGSPPNPFHQGRLTSEDFKYMETFMLAQDYITDFQPMSKSAEITHNLDKFRPLFVSHPGNYVDIYATAFGISDPKILQALRNTPWLKASPKREQARSVVINRTARWCPRILSGQWDQWRSEGVEDASIFVGLPEEHREFQKSTGWLIPRADTPTMLDLAQLISGADLFIGNQSVALSLAIGLGKTVYCEARDDLPLERNECFFPDNELITYF
jgi:hypothetical protein